MRPACASEDAWSLRPAHAQTRATAPVRDGQLPIDGCGRLLGSTERSVSVLPFLVTLESTRPIAGQVYPALDRRRHRIKTRRADEERYNPNPEAPLVLPPPGLRMPRHPYEPNEPTQIATKPTPLYPRGGEPH